MNKKYTSKFFLFISCGIGLLSSVPSYADDMNSAGLSIVGVSHPVVPNTVPPVVNEPIYKKTLETNINNSSLTNTIKEKNSKPISMEPIYSPGDAGYQAVKEDLSNSEMPNNMVAPVYVSPREKREQLKKEQIKPIYNTPSLSEQIKNVDVDSNIPKTYQSTTPVKQVVVPKQVVAPVIPTSNLTPSSTIPVAIPVSKTTKDAVIRIWHVSPRHTVNDILADWGEKAGWTVAFKTNQVYEIEASADFEGDFISAATSLLKSVHAEPRFKAVFHSGNKVLVVGNTFQQVE